MSEFISDRKSRASYLYTLSSFSDHSSFHKSEVKWSLSEHMMKTERDVPKTIGCCHLIQIKLFHAAMPVLLSLWHAFLSIAEMWLQVSALLGIFYFFIITIIKVVFTNGH